MIIITTENHPTRETLKVLGVVRGSTVRARNVGKDFMASLKSIVGGEISEYTRLLANSREEAIRRMAEDAMRLGANAVVNVRFSTSAVMQGAAEILVYGTAVVLEDRETGELQESFPEHEN